MTNNSIEWILLEEKLKPSKDNISWNHFKGRMLCQVDWESILSQIHNHKSVIVMHKVAEVQ